MSGLDRETPEIETNAGIPERYAVKALIGRGGMGVVYEAIDTSLNIPVAIKILHEDSGTTAEARQRFLKEAKALAALSHENIVRIRQLGISEQGKLYQVMELLRGKTLETRIEREKRMHGDKFIAIFTQLIDALSYASTMHIVHRDIKPGNIFLCDGGDNVRAVLLDFGIAKTLQEDPEKTATSTGLLSGSPHYMSPEQCRGEAVDCKSDIYSLGCVMYQCLTGAPPFNGDTAAKILYQHMHESPYSLKFEGAEPYELRCLSQSVLACLSKERAERPDYQQLKRQLLKCAPQSWTLRFTTVVAPEPQQSRAKKFILRSLAIAFSVGILVAAGMWHRAEYVIEKSSADDGEKLKCKVQSALRRYYSAKKRGVDTTSLANVLCQDLPQLYMQCREQHKYDEAESIMQQVVTISDDLPESGGLARVRAYMHLHWLCEEARRAQKNAPKRLELSGRSEAYLRQAIDCSRQKQILSTQCEGLRMLCLWLAVERRLQESKVAFESYLTVLGQLTEPPEADWLPRSMWPPDKRMSEPIAFVTELETRMGFERCPDKLLLAEYCLRLAQFMRSIGSDKMPICLRAADKWLVEAVNEQAVSDREFAARVDNLKDYRQRLLIHNATN